jgi:hypothetical protein
MLQKLSSFAKDPKMRACFKTFILNTINPIFCIYFFKFPSTPYSNWGFHQWGCAGFNLLGWLLLATNFYYLPKLILITFSNLGFISETKTESVISKLQNASLKFFWLGILFLIGLTLFILYEIVSMKFLLFSIALLGFIAMLVLFAYLKFRD